MAMVESTAKALVGRRIADIPADAGSFICVALVKPRSPLARDWNLPKPAFCLYEYTRWAVHKHEIRWGDGSGQRIDPEDYDSLVLVHEFDEEALAVLFDG
ncbi:hypothetical protein [Luteimonas sp. MHLX1A]|uniref:hypothetical protein n=1 Tax=Alterluteimonas muca TaxID=2878684 RepID=UPI001E34E962|nr:hypothetical protein [Luteimonas sp. MHLX1A]